MEKGKIIQISGPVVDVMFEKGPLPHIKEALTVENQGKQCVMEVAKQLGNNIIRCIMLSASEGLCRDMEVTPTGAGITVPVGEKTLGRLFNVLGEAIDDGEPVTASDWVFTAQLITNPKFDYGLRSEFNTWAGTDDTGTEESEKSVQVEAVDDYTLKINFKSVIPVEDWLILHNKYFYVLPEHLLKDMAPEEIKTSDFWKAPVGSGPCTFISELSGSELQLGSFADYHMGAPKFGKLVLKVIAATNTITSIAAGEMDGFFQAPTVDDALAAKDMGLNVEQSAEPTTVAVFLINNQNVPDKKVRQAMSYAIDKQMLIDQSLQGQGVPATTCIIPGSQYEFGTKWEEM